jgi:beta-mannosidase
LIFEASVSSEDHPEHSSAMSLEWIASFEGTFGSVTRWWPHTHGNPTLYSISAHITEPKGTETKLHVGAVGFRSVSIDQQHGNFEVAINDTPVLCRGASWTPVDPVSLNPSDNEIDDALDQLVSAGINMVRLSGTMVYETNRFYQRCDELGIMVWQDFMFANLDYPQDNEQLSALINQEVHQLLGRIGQRPSTTILCGGSEVDQQASMMGLPSSEWQQTIARTLIAPICQQLAPHIPFVASSPQVSPTANDHELPFHVNRNVGHYFGVGAYLRGLSDARSANVRFAAECLAFANVPEERTLEELFGDTPITMHHPLWKQRVPRDNGAGWDFDDVRDHYAHLLFGDAGVGDRYFDAARARDFARLTSAAMMTAVASEWRRAESPCNGSLIWFLRDLWAGAGWGIVDTEGRAKAPFFALSRVWQPITVALTDEGVNGIDAHLVNETVEALEGNLELVVVREDGHRVVDTQRAISLPPRSNQTVRLDSLVDGFRDLNWAYRFGPPIGEVARVRLTTESHKLGTHTIDAHHWITPRPTALRQSIGLTANGIVRPDGRYNVRVRTDYTALGVHLDVEGFHPSDNWFDLIAGDEINIRLTPKRSTIPTRQPKVTAYSVNSAESVRVAWVETP